MSVQPIGPSSTPAEDLASIFDEEIDTAGIASRRGQKIYESVRKLSELIGGEYGDRVIYELLQNAHDAHPADKPGHIGVRLVIEADDRGVLYVANGGRAFTKANLQAMRNIATSTKEIGEGIGNKGVGFRSIEALTSDARIYSRSEASRTGKFDGYCFRFAGPEEVEQRARALGFADVAEAISQAMPQYLAAVPLKEQPQEVQALAAENYVTVVALFLKTTDAVTLALKQVRELLTSDAPVLLFLDRVKSLVVEIRRPGAAAQIKTLTRHPVGALPSPVNLPSCTLEKIVLGPQKRHWLIVRRVVPSARIQDAVQRSLALEKGLKPWLEWKGDAVVGLATPLDGRSLAAPRLYTFLPMAESTGSPLPAHLDAPFFTSIDRRRAKLDLPLNAELLSAAAEAAAAAAIALAGSGSTDASPRVVTDLVTWRRSDLARIQTAFRSIGEDWKAAKVWPTLNSGWTSLQGLRVWPDGKFKVFTSARAGKISATPILSPLLTADRASAIRDLAEASLLRMLPSATDLAVWAEGIAAGLPRTEPAMSRVWAPFYTDLYEAFGRKADDLIALKGRAILVERGGTLIEASADVYVRHDGGRRSRNDGPPTPPRDVARILKVLDEKIVLRPEVLAAFERAALCRRYDPTEILAELPSLFGGKPAPGRRRAALLWAFDVWRHDMAGARKALSRARLHVPTRNGEWTPAEEACFSETWSDVGRHLDAYLSEAGALDGEAAASAGRLLVSFDGWLGQEDASRTDWLKFLADAGVTDGLLPLKTAMVAEAEGQNWRWIFAGNAVLATDPAWQAANGFDGVAHRLTSYHRRGEAWRLPGQKVFDDLSTDARRRLARLIIQLLERSGSAFLTFQLGRFDRNPAHHDAQKIRTPVGVFLTQQAWLPVTGEDDAFAQIADAWLMTDRRSDPKFVARIQDEIADRLAPDAEAFATLREMPFSLRLWRDKETARDRLQTLADAADGLEQSHRAVFRKQYDQAWRDLIELAGAPPALLATERASGYASLLSTTPPDRVYVRSERSRDLTRLLIETGEPVLVGSGEVNAAAVVDRLNEHGAFRGLPVEASDIRLVVDGAPFAPGAQDALIVDLAPWMSDAVFLAHELKAQDLEKSINEALIRERLDVIRVRSCETIALRPADGPDKALDHYVIRDDGWPVILLTGPLSTDRLSDMAAVLASLIHTNLKSLEPVLLRLALQMRAGVLLSHQDPPSAGDYAAALRVDIDTVQELLDSRQGDHSRALALLSPFLVYELGLGAASGLLRRLEGAPRKTWPSVLNTAIPDAGALLDRLRETEDLGAVRRERGMDFARFNQALKLLGQKPISHAGAIRRQFEVWKTELAPTFIDHLRRTAHPKLDQPGVLQAYAVDRLLDFIVYDATWEDTREGLEREDIRLYGEALLVARVGPDPGGVLPDREKLRHSNRKLLAAFAREADRVLQALNVPLAPQWTAGPQEVADEADRRGVLDFEPIVDGHQIEVLVRAGLWPAGVKPTVDLNALGLTAGDLDAQDRARKAAERSEAIRKNSITFDGDSFDTTETGFAQRFAAEAADRFANCEWKSRSILRPTALKVFAERPDPEPGGPGGSRNKPPRQIVRPPEPIRAAMGLAGELLAYHWLAARHGQRFTEASWVSENRATLFPEAGDPRLGFDFRVATSDTEWLYEVKATTGDLTEFELTDNEYRTAAGAAADRSRRYRILFVQNVFDLDRCRVLELPNPAGPALASFDIIGRSSRRMRFEQA